MNPYQINLTEQNKKVPYQIYDQGPITNPTQTKIKYSNQIIQQYGSSKLVKSNPIPSVYRRLNTMPPEINKINQQQNIKLFSPNQNIIQPKNLNQNTSNINEIISGYNLHESRIINNLINNSMIQNSRNKSKNGHPPIPMKLSIEAMQSICKISYHYNNETTFGTGFFMKYSDTLKLLITNYHVIFPELINNKFQIEIWNNKKIILNLLGRYYKFLEFPKDITAIEIKTTDDIYKDIK